MNILFYLLIIIILIILIYILMKNLIQNKSKKLYKVPVILTKVVDRMSDGYLVLNEKNIITDFNKTLLKMFEIDYNSLKSMHIFDLLKLENFKPLEEQTIINILKATKESTETLVIEKEFKSIKKFIQIEISNLRSKNVFIGTLILFKDTTEHHKDAEIIKSNTNILIEKERLASLGEMISGVTHNLKTPIFSISGATEGLTDLINEYRSSIDDPSVTIEDHKEIAKIWKIGTTKSKNIHLICLI